MRVNVEEVCEGECGGEGGFMWRRYRRVSGVDINGGAGLGHGGGELAGAWPV